NSSTLLEHYIKVILKSDKIIQNEVFRCIKLIISILEANEMDIDEINNCILHKRSALMVLAAIPITDEKGFKLKLNLMKLLNTDNLKEYQEDLSKSITQSIIKGDSKHTIRLNKLFLKYVVSTMTKITTVYSSELKRSDVEITKNTLGIQIGITKYDFSPRD